MKARSLVSWHANMGENVRDYGARGDGFRDDLPAIQAAVYAAERGCGAVYYPPGVYNATGRRIKRMRSRDRFAHVRRAPMSKLWRRS